MPKKISQKRLNYTLDANTTSVGTTFNYNDAEDPVYHNVHLPRDFSIVNRQNMEMTTRKGVPYVWGGRLTATLSAIDMGEDAPDGAGTPGLFRDDLITVRILAPMSNWVMKNAAVKTHAARENMFKKAIIDPKDRGAYGKTIRYCLQSNGEGYLDPVHSTSRTPFTGGTWDHSQIYFEPDTSGAYIKLSGGHLTEESNVSFTDLCLPQMYLQSRGSVEPDSNEDTTDQAKFSVLNKLLTWDTTDVNDEVVSLAKDEQDEPPYDISDAQASDFNNLIEIGRLQFNAMTGSTASCYIEVPFGIFSTQTQVLASSQGVDADLSLDLSFDLMKVGEM